MNEDLAEMCEQLRGFNEDLDEIADRIEALSTRKYNRDQRQATVARLAGSYEDDLITTIAVLAQHLSSVPADEEMGDDDRKDAERHGQDIALLFQQPYLHQPAAEAAWLIDPTT